MYFGAIIVTLFTFLHPNLAHAKRVKKVTQKTVTVIASQYGGEDGFDGQTTASCTVFDSDEKTAAHKTLPFGTQVLLENPKNGCKEIATITDRGPFKKGRDIDVAKGVAEPLEFDGVTKLVMHILYVPEKPVMGNACKRDAS